ncbi:MAG: NAD(P)/FAD-dependent oxidoreductase [Novosphingobium sp.]
MYRDQTAAFGPASHARPLDIAVVGSGISGLSAAWLLSKRHRVTLFEADDRIGGHSNTVDAGGVAVDTGFIVYNEATYPNFTALLSHLGVRSDPTEMSFAVSLGGGACEYSGSGLSGLFSQKRNLLRPRFWHMLRELLRFYREAPQGLAALGDESIDAYLDRRGYGRAFREDHLYPMAAAIWSSPATGMRHYPAASFIAFCHNHNLLQTGPRPPWRTVRGGSRSYVQALLSQFDGTVRSNTPVHRIERDPAGVTLHTPAGPQRFDQVVIATHSDQALAMLASPDAAEHSLLSAMRYSRNDAVLHSDTALMPQRRKVWSAWNFLASADPGASPSVTYWMNRLQHIETKAPMLVTLNPASPPDPALVHWQGTYHHPVFDSAAIAAQQKLWSLQGRHNTWFCGAWLGAGFHEDGLQAGLAVAEQLGGLRRPWHLDQPSSRIVITPRELLAA